MATSNAPGSMKADHAVVQAGHKPNPKNNLVIKDHAGKSRDQLMAELGLSSIVPNANTARGFAEGVAGELDLTETVAVVRRVASAVQSGNLSDLEGTLAAQAITLDAIFTEMARRAALNMGEYINATEIYLRLGLKAQAQCRATVQTLFEMKNPQPVAFIKQANVAHGPQQVNNGATDVGAPGASRARISANQSNKLMGLEHEQRVDIGTASSTSRDDSRLDPVGAVDWSEN